MLRWLSTLSHVTSCSLYGSSTLAALCRTGYWGSTISGSLSHLVAVFLEIPSLRLAWRTDRPSRKTRRRNLLKVPTLITPGHPCTKNEQDRPMKWLKFGCKFPSKWLSFQSQSTQPVQFQGSYMTLCPIALMATCNKCPAVGICPLKEVLGDHKPENLASAANDASVKDKISN